MSLISEETFYRPSVTVYSRFEVAARMEERNHKGQEYLEIYQQKIRIS
jgi:hypothetical protein